MAQIQLEENTAVCDSCGCGERVFTYTLQLDEASSGWASKTTMAIFKKKLCRKCSGNSNNMNILALFCKDTKCLSAG